MTETNELDVMGSDPIVATEVNEQAEETQSEFPDSGKENSVPETVPYNRFSEVNARKNELEKQSIEDQALIKSLSQNVNEYLETNKAPESNEDPQIETIDDVMSYINKAVDSRVKPIEEQRLIETYTNNVESFFSSNKDAESMRGQIDEYYNNLPSYRRESIVTAISKGDTSVLNEIKNTVALQHNKNITNMTQEAVLNDATRTMSPNASKIVKESKPGFSDLIKKGKETGNFDSVISQFIMDAGLA